MTADGQAYTVEEIELPGVEAPEVVFRFRVTVHGGSVYNGTGFKCKTGEAWELFGCRCSSAPAPHAVVSDAPVVSIEPVKPLKRIGDVIAEQCRARDPHVCNDGWVCEAHVDQPFPHGDCAGPGMPCGEGSSGD